MSGTSDLLLLLVVVLDLAILASSRLTTCIRVSALQGVLLASLPPSAGFLGKAMLDDALIAQGYGWTVVVVVAASALTGGAVLLAAARIFGGLGQELSKNGVLLFSRGKGRVQPVIGHECCLRAMNRTAPGAGTQDPWNGAAESQAGEKEGCGGRPDRATQARTRFNQG